MPPYLLQRNLIQEQKMLGQYGALANIRERDRLLAERWGTMLDVLYPREIQRKQVERQAAMEQERLNLSHEEAKARERQATWSAVAGIPTNLALIEMVTRGKEGEPGWIGKGYDWATGKSTTGKTAETTAEAGGGISTAGQTAAMAPSLSAYYGTGTLGGPVTGTAPAVSAASPSAYYGTGTLMAGEMGVGTAPTATGVTSGAGYTLGSQAGATTGTTAGTTAGSGALAGAGWGAAGGVAGSYLGREYGQKLPYTGSRKERSVVGGVLGGMLAGGTATSWSGPGAVIGAIIGGAVGYASTTVICTELHRQGYFGKDLLDLEKIYQPNFSWETYWGYRMWADPIARRMKKSKLLTKIVSLFGVPFIKEVAHRVEPERKGSRFGSLIIRVGVPFCRWNFNRNPRIFYARFHKVTEESNG